MRELVERALLSHGLLGLQASADARFTPSRAAQSDGSVHLYTLVRAIVETQDLSCRPRLDATAEALRELGYRPAQRGEFKAWLPPGCVSKLGRPPKRAGCFEDALLLPPNSVSRRASPEIVVERIEGQTTVARGGSLSLPPGYGRSLTGLPEAKRRSAIATLKALAANEKPWKRARAFSDLVRAIHDRYGGRWLDDGFVALFNAMLVETRASVRPAPQGLPSRWRVLASGPDSMGRTRRELYAWPRQRTTDYRGGGDDDSGAIVPIRELLLPG